jgi:choline dehydrogenase
MMCTYASKGDIDNWEKLGNPGWSHGDLAPYFKKFQSFTEPSKEIAEFYHTEEVIEPDLHNGGGPVKTSFPHNKRLAGDAWVKTYDKLGLKMNVDPQSGLGTGGYRSVFFRVSLTTH